MRGQQRVAAEGEEVVVQADTRQAEHFAPDACNLLLQGCFRFNMFAALPHRLRQRTTVEFAAGAQRHGVQVHQQRRHHVLRQLSREGGF